MSRSALFLSLSLAAMPTGAALAQHTGDVLVENIDNRLTTGLLQGRTTIHDHRIFAAEFGEVFRNFTDEPGFDSPAGAFAPGSTIGFNVLDALRSWDGGGFGSPASSTLTISFANLSIETGSGFVEGFGLPVAQNGEWHRHLNFILNEPAPPGIYLLALELWSDDPGLERSEPFYIVFNQEMDELIHDEAIEWAERYLVPGIRFHDVDLAAGRANEFAVLGATPGRRVTFVYGLAPGSTTIPGCPGVRLRIHRPTVMGSAPADGSGRAAITRFVPAGASGRIVFFGAVEQGSCTVGNLLEHSFE